MYNLMKLSTGLNLLNEYELSTLEIIFGAILIVAALLIIFVVLMQEGRQANVGVISGAADSFMDKGAAKSLDQKLSKWTKVIAIVFFLLVLAAMFVSQFGTNKAKNDKMRTEASISASIAAAEAAKTTTTTTTTTSSATTTTTAPVVEDKEDADQGEADTDADADKDNASDEGDSEAAE